MAVKTFQLEDMYIYRDCIYKNDEKSFLGVIYNSIISLYRYITISLYFFKLQTSFNVDK